MGACSTKGSRALPYQSRASMQKELERLQRENATAQKQLRELRQPPPQPAQGKEAQAAAPPPASGGADVLLPTLLAGLPRSSSGQSGASTPVDFTDPVAESLNSLLEHMWPSISAYTSRVLLEEVEPALQAALPQALKGLQFDKNRCQLGSRPPEFRKVTISKETQDTVEGSIENLVLRCRVDWKADCNICLEFAGVSVGIDALHVRGVLLIELVGIVPRPPMFEGFRMFFVNPPELDLDFQGAGHGLLNIGVIKAKILDVISDQISGALVNPNRLGMKLDLDADIFRITSPPSEGILKVCVRSAEKLLPLDFHCCGQGTSDPYVEVRCGAHRFRSPTVYRTLSPSFQYEVLFPISSPHQRVQFTVMDEDLVSSDDFLGKLSLPVSLLAASCGKEITMSLQDERGSAGKRGQVRVSAEWRPLVLHSLGLGGARGPGILFAGAYCASNVPDMGDGATYWLVMSCGGIMPGAPSKPQETLRLERSAETRGGWEAQAKTAALRSKLAVLRKYGMSEADMAGVLDVDPSRLGQALMLASETKAVDELASADSVQVEWEQGFEFLVEDLHSAAVTFELWCQTRDSASSNLLGSSSTPQMLGSCQWRVAEYRRPMTTLQIPGTSISLHLRLRLLQLGEPSTRMGTVTELIPEPGQE